MLRGKEVISTFNERYSQSWEKLKTFQDEALIDMQYYLGQQYSAKEIHYLQDNNRESITNNKILRAVNLVTGEQRLNRLGSVVLPLNDNIEEEVLTADQYSSLVQFILQKQHGYHHFSECFKGALISGINFSEMYFDYSNDFVDGDIKFLRIPYNAIMWDPYFQNLDLSDCNYLLRRKYISKSAAIGLLPDRAKDIKKLDAQKRDGKFPDIPFESNANGQELLAYNEYWERDTRLALYMINMQTSERIEFPAGTKKKEAERLINDANRFFGQGIMTLVEKYRGTVNKHIIIEDQEFYSGADPADIDDYPLTAFVALQTPEYNDYSLNIQSFIRAARDPQKELNKRISKAIDMMDSRLYGGHYFKKSKICDEDDLFSAGNHGNIALEEDATIGQDIAPIVLPDVPASVFQMQNIFDENVMSVLNLNDAAFGAPQSGVQSAFMTMLQQSSAMMGLQPFYDNLNTSQCMATFKLAKMTQKWSDRKVERITGKPVSPMFRDKDFSRYDTICAQAVLTEHQKKLQFMQLVELRTILGSDGANVITASMLAKRAPVQDQGEFLAEIKANEEAAAQQAQEMQQIQMQKEALAAELVQSQIRENEADTVRQTGRAVADVGLTQAHIAEADQKRASAVLDMAKAAGEIAENENQRFYSAIDFITQLQDRYREQNQQELLLDKAIVDSSVNKLKTPTTQQQQPVGV